MRFIPSVILISSCLACGVDVDSKPSAAPAIHQGKCSYSIPIPEYGITLEKCADVQNVNSDQLLVFQSEICGNEQLPGTFEEGQICGNENEVGTCEASISLLGLTFKTHYYPFYDAQSSAKDCELTRQAISEGQ